MAILVGDHLTAFESDLEQSTRTCLTHENPWVVHRRRKPEAKTKVRGPSRVEIRGRVGRPCCRV